MVKKLLIGSLTSIILVHAYAQSKIDQKIDSLIANANYTSALNLIHSQSSSAILANKEAEVLMALGKLDESENLLSKISTSNNAFLNAITGSNLGFLYLLKGRSDRAL